MKRIFNTTTMLLFLLAIATHAQAQSTKAGIKGGVNFSNLMQNEFDDEDMRVGFHAGVYGQYMFASETMALQPEILYSAKGSRAYYDFAGINGDVKFNINYIDVPVLLVFKLGESVDIQVGPYFSYLLNASVTSEGDLGDYDDDIDRDNFHSLDYGLVGGLAFNFNPVSLGVRYNYGLRPIAESDVAEELLDNAKNSVGQVYIAFNFGQ
ncbi:MAG: PorT family protein [Cyclobacteriaceae bacterium]|nr:PorT family protein [Cyclobacteriaceae bacterium]